MNSFRQRVVPSALLGGLVFLLAGELKAQTTNCSSLPNPVYLQIGDTQENLIKALGRKMRDSAVHPMTLIYLTSGSCTNIDALFNGTKLTMNPKYLPSMAEDPNWVMSDASPTCTIDPAGVALDIGNSNVEIDACTQTPVPATIGIHIGAIQPYVFVMPAGSTGESAIYAEEAYFVFGFPNGGMVAPWTDTNVHMIRPNTKSTLVALAANINVPPAKWMGMRFDTSTQVVMAVEQSTEPEQTIGILGAEVYDANRTNLKALAFRAYGQKYAYYPDSTATAHDKQNTRDGHYTPWSPTIYMTPISNGAPTSTLAATLLSLIQGKQTTPAEAFEPLDTQIAVGLVPDCAMKVSRMHEGGDLALYSPAEPCGCYFESKVGATLDASCTVCSESMPCTTGTCRHGFCEAR